MSKKIEQFVKDRLVLCAVAVAILSFIFGRTSYALVRWFAGNYPNTTPNIIREPRQAAYKYINPLLMVDIPVIKNMSPLKQLEDNVDSLIKDEVDRGEITTASVYFHDPKNGQWISVNGAEEYSPASLKKVPMMITYFKDAEIEPTILDKSIFYKDNGEDMNVGEVFRAKKFITPGNSYTIDQLIQYMILYSDNNATRLLYENISSNDLNEVFTDLGVHLPYKEQDNFMTVKNYASFFRVLYSSTYLNRYYSEKALEYLAESDFSAGISAGVPAGVPVAQKFGERTLLSAVDGSVRQLELHDCGEVYKADHNYVVCIMTRGKDFVKMANTIKSASRMIYDSI